MENVEEEIRCVLLLYERCVRFGGSMKMKNVIIEVLFLIIRILRIDVFIKLIRMLWIYYDYFEVYIFNVLYFLF